MIVGRQMNTSPREGGSVLVESALSLLAFLMLIFGIAEAGRLLEVQSVLTNAAREGARFGVTPLCSTCGTGQGTLPSVGDIQNWVNTFLTAAAVSVPMGNIVVTKTTTHTQVTITFSYVALTGLFPDLGIDLVGNSLMRNETSP